MGRALRWIDAAPSIVPAADPEQDRPPRGDGRPAAPRPPKSAA